MYDRNPKKTGISRANGSSLRREKGIGVEYVVKKLNEEKPRNRVQSEDTILRQEIHNEIKRLLEYGLKEHDVLDIINQKFKDSKYKEFFESWISDKAKKVEVKSSKEENVR